MDCKTALEATLNKEKAMKRHRPKASKTNVLPVEHYVNMSLSLKAIFTSLVPCHLERKSLSSTKSCAIA